MGSMLSKASGEHMDYGGRGTLSICALPEEREGSEQPASLSSAQIGTDSSKPVP